jgi:hypothetical protein
MADVLLQDGWLVAIGLLADKGSRVVSGYCTIVWLARSFRMAD